MLMNSFSAIFRCGQAFINRHLQHSDITYGEQAILMYLASAEPTNQDSIARYFFLDKGAIAKTMSHLEQKQLIVRSVNPANQREKLLQLTEQGRAHITEMQAAREAWEQCLYEGLSPGEIIQLEQITTKIEQNAIRHLRA